MASFILVCAEALIVRDDLFGVSKIDDFAFVQEDRLGRGLKNELCAVRNDDQRTRTLHQLFHAAVLAGRRDPASVAPSQAGSGRLSSQRHARRGRPSRRMRGASME